MYTHRAVFYPNQGVICEQNQEIIQVYLRTSVSVFFLNSTLFAIISITDSRTSTNNASSLVTSIITFIAYSNQSTGSNIRIANYTTSITFFTQSTDSHTSLFSTKYQVWMMFCHILKLIFFPNSNERFRTRLSVGEKMAKDDNNTRN